MLDSRLLMTFPAGSPANYNLWGVWIPRRGDDLTLPIEVTANSNAKVGFEIYHKNYGDVGDGASVGAGAVFDGVAEIQVVEAPGVKELVRVLLEVGVSGEPTPGTIGWFLFRFLQPNWSESVEA